MPTLCAGSRPLVWWHSLEQAPFLKSYTTYCMQFEASNDLLSKLSNTKLKRFLKKQHALPETRSLGLESYLIMPVQRIPRYNQSRLQ